jgi:glucan phosphoethanolaminetransferase (alkaline phosphatase superfamily)
MMDSVVKLGNTIGYSTYWISTQGQSGPDDSTIAAIAQSATHQFWLSGSDELILDALKKVIMGSEQRIVFVHINGSHEPPCSKVSPDTLKFFNGDQEDACYDSTIWNTDRILEKITAALKNTPSAVLYFSDHGLVKRRGQFMHASGIPPQQAVDVPMYVWFSSHIKHPLQGTRIQGSYATMHNYYLMADLMGVYVDNQPCLSALSSCYDYAAPIMISDTSGTTHPYTQLRKEPGLPTSEKIRR